MEKLQEYEDKKNKISLLSRDEDKLSSYHVDKKLSVTTYPNDVHNSSTMNVDKKQGKYLQSSIVKNRLEDTQHAIRVKEKLATFTQF